MTICAYKERRLSQFVSSKSEVCTNSYYTCSHGLSNSYVHVARASPVCTFMKRGMCHFVCTRSHGCTNSYVHVARAVPIPCMYRTTSCSKCREGRFQAAHVKRIASTIISPLAFHLAAAASRSWLPVATPYTAGSTRATSSVRSLF